MHWPTITVDVDEDLKDAVVDEFASDGLVGVGETPGSGDAVTLILYFEEGRVPPLVDARIGRICEKNGTAAPHIDRGFQEQQDWPREWRRRYKSFPVGYGFQIVSSWEEPHSQDGRIVIRIDPRQAFGTGAHETTEMLLEALEEFSPGAHMLNSQVDRLRDRLREEGMPILRELGRGDWVAMIVGDGD